MSYIENVNKITREALRRVSKLARQRLSNEQNQSVRWSGYNGASRPIVKAAEGRLFTVSNLSNTGQKKGTKMQWDTAGSVVKPRRLPTGDEEVTFPSEAKYNSHYFALKRSDGACVVIRVRERVGTYSLAGSLSQDEVEQAQSNRILVDAVVVNYGATTDIVDGFTQINENSYNKLFRGKEIRDFVGYNKKGYYKEVNTIGGSVSADLIELDLFSIDQNGYNLSLSSPIIFRPWGLGLVMGAGLSDGSTNYVDGSFLRRDNEIPNPDDSSKYFFSINEAIMAYNNFLGSVTIPAFGIWSYADSIISTHELTWADTARIAAKCQLTSEDETGGETIILSPSSKYVTHNEDLYKYKITACGELLVEYVITFADINYFVPSGVSDSYRLRKFVSDFTMKGPWVVEILDGYIDREGDGSTLSDLTSFGSYKAISPNSRISGWTWRDPTGSSLFAPYIACLFIEFAEYTENQTAVTRYWTPRVYPGTEWPNTKFDVYNEFDAYRIGSRIANDYQNAPIGTSEGFGRAFVTLNPSVMRTDVYYEEPPATLQDVNYYPDISGNEEYITRYTPAQRVPVDINHDNQMDPELSYDDTAFQKLSITSNTVELVDSDSKDGFFLDIESGPEEQRVPTKPRHDFIVHVLNEQTGSIDSFPQSTQIQGDQHPSWEWHPPEICVELYGRTFWLTRSFAYPEVEWNIPNTSADELSYDRPVLYEGLEYPRPISFYTKKYKKSPTGTWWPANNLVITHVREVTRTRKSELNVPVDQELVEWHTLHQELDGTTNYTVRMGTLDDFRTKTFSESEIGLEVRVDIGDLVDSNPLEYVVLRNYQIKLEPINFGDGSFISWGASYDFTLKAREAFYGEYWIEGDMTLTNGFAKSTYQTNNEIVLYFDQKNLFLCEVNDELPSSFVDYSLDFSGYLDAITQRVSYTKLGFSQDILQALAIQPHIVNTPFSPDIKINEPFDLVALPHSRSLGRLFEIPQSTASGVRVRIGEI